MDEWIFIQFEKNMAIVFDTGSCRAFIADAVNPEIILRALF